VIRALIVGAGAVGQVYGAHLQKAGVRVGLFVKPKHAAACRRGLTLHRHRLFRSPITHVFTPDEVFTEMAEVESTRWDLVMLCVPSSALEGDFLGPLLRGAGEATVVKLQPGMNARSLLTRVIPEERLVSGTIAFIAYQAPLGPDALAPGVAYLFPPLAATQLSGGGPRPSAVVALLRRGGCPARVHDDASTALMFSSSLLMPMVTALHAAGWSFSRLARGDWLALGARAVGEAMRVAEAETEARAPRSRHLVRPALIRAVLALAPKIMPFDLERYLRAHFTKVDAQSRILLNDYREAARRHGIDASGIERLYQEVYGDDEALDPMLERRHRIRSEIARSIESFELEEDGPGELTVRGVSRFGPSLVGPPGRLHGGLHAYARLFRILEEIPAHDGARTFPCRATLRLGKPIMLGEPVAFEGRYRHDADGYTLEIRHDETERLSGTVRSVAAEGDPLARFRDPYARARRSPRSWRNSISPRGSTRSW
jgi:ketopantoate reductase